MHLTPDIHRLLTQEEGQYFDRKSAKIAPKDIVRHLIAFANASGGILAIGVEDDGRITGFGHARAHSIDAFCHVLNEQRMPTPCVTERLPVVNEQGAVDEVLLFHIEPSISQIIEANDGNAYLRSKDQSMLLKYEQRRQLEYDKGQRAFEDEIAIGAEFDDLDLVLLTQYQQNLSTSMAIEDILKARSLMTKDGRITYAGILLFGKNPTQFLPNARLKILKYDGDSQKTGVSFNVIKEFHLDSAIVAMIPEAKRLIASQLREFQSLDSQGNFTRVDEYPEFAWFEGVVNALTHRNYALRGDYVRVSIYDDHLEVFSPGVLPNIVTLENMRSTRYSRNPRIARVLTEFGWVKELNEGVKRIFNEMETLLFSTPIYDEPDNNSVRLSLVNNILQRNLRSDDKLPYVLSDETFQTLNQHERLALQYVFEYGQVTTKTLMTHLAKSDTLARRTLKSLEQKGLLVWHGNSQRDPTQHYVLNDSSSE